jgi:hypothetical protein
MPYEGTGEVHEKTFLIDIEYQECHGRCVAYITMMGASCYIGWMCFAMR